MTVVQTSPHGVVNRDTIFVFSQQGTVISAEYSGGKIVKGFLVGVMNDARLNFSYCQLQSDGNIDNGISSCEVSLTPGGKIRLTEHFEWKSREGVTGTNIFEELSTTGNHES